MKPLCLTTLIAVIACAPDPEPVERASSNIINGKVHTGDPAVMVSVAMLGQGQALCTATLITPKILLAAAHCVSGPQLRNAKFGVSAANTLADISSGRMPLIPVETVAADPRFGGAANPTTGYDFGVLVLKDPLSTTPIALNRGPTMMGEPVRYIGYGISDAAEALARAMGRMPMQNSSGTKREATATLGPMQSGSTRLVTVTNPVNNVCSGDSGGPLFIKRDGVEKIAGIASFTVPTCQGVAGYGLVDQQLDWIDEQIRKYDPDTGLARDAGAGDAREPLDAGQESPSAMDAAWPDTGQGMTPTADAAPTPRVDAGAAMETAPPTADAGRPPTLVPPGVEGGCSFAPVTSVPSTAAPLFLALVIHQLRRRRRNGFSRP